MLAARGTTWRRQTCVGVVVHALVSADEQATFWLLTHGISPLAVAVNDACVQRGWDEVALSTCAGSGR